MKFFLMIMNEQNKPFSHPKPNSPKMYNVMVEICKKYTEIFKESYKVKRVIKVKNGWKTI